MGRADAFSEVHSLFQQDMMSILLCNIRGLVHNSGELIGRIKLMDREPDIVCLNETWLDKSIKAVTIDGYTCVGRRDRQTGQKCGGVATYARSSLARQITLLENSTCAERQWLLVHADQGPILLCNWYRPPDDAASIASFEPECVKHADVALKRVVVGDLNLHHRAWLHYSNGDTPLGREFHGVTSRLGLCQIVRGPTRNEYLLDLILTDCSDAKAEVCAKITDHSLVLTTLRTSVPHSKEHERIVWQFNKADWEGLDAAVKAVPWSRIMSMTPDEGAEFLTDTTLAKVKEYIPTRRITERASSHPWLTINVIAKIRQKKEAEGTSGEKEAAEACNKKS